MRVRVSLGKSKTLTWMRDKKKEENNKDKTISVFGHCVTTTKTSTNGREGRRGRKRNKI